MQIEHKILICIKIVGLKGRFFMETQDLVSLNGLQKNKVVSFSRCLPGHWQVGNKDGFILNICNVFLKSGSSRMRRYCIRDAGLKFPAVKNKISCLYFYKNVLTRLARVSKTRDNYLVIMNGMRKIRAAEGAFLGAGCWVPET